MLPTAAPANMLANSVLIADLPENVIQQRVQRIQRDLLAHSNYLREPGFKAIHVRDLEFWFRAYDQQFFAGHCGTWVRSRRFPAAWPIDPIEVVVSMRNRHVTPASSNDTMIRP